jgi:hypothetical protein
MGALLRGLSSQLLKLILTGITFFFFLKGGEVILASIRKGLSGVIGPSLDGYIDTIRSTVYAVTFGLLMDQFEVSDSHILQCPAT